MRTRTMAERYLILSDLHLGKEPRRINAGLLRPVWRRGDHVIVNGDLAEIHDPRYQDEACQMVLELEDACEADGVTLTLLAGNHDPGLTERRHLFLHGGHVLVTHGDAITPSIAPWCVTAPLMREAYDAAMASLPVERRDRLEAQLWATRRAAAVKWEAMRNKIGWLSVGGLLLRPWSFAQVLRYWWAFPGMAAAWLREFAPEAKVLVTGHTHHQGTWQVGDVTVINTGCYAFPGRPRAVVVEGDALGVHRVRRRDDGTYALEEAALSTIRLPAASGAPSATPADAADATDAADAA